MLVSGEAKASVEKFLGEDHTFEEYTNVSNGKHGIVQLYSLMTVHSDCTADIRTCKVYFP